MSINLESIAIGKFEEHPLNVSGPGFIASPVMKLSEMKTKLRSVNVKIVSIILLNILCIYVFCNVLG